MWDSGACDPGGAIDFSAQRRTALRRMDRSTDCSDSLVAGGRSVDRLPNSAGSRAEADTWSFARYFPKWTSTLYTLLLLKGLGAPSNVSTEKACRILFRAGRVAGVRKVSSRRCPVTYRAECNERGLSRAANFCCGTTCINSVPPVCRFTAT